MDETVRKAKKKYGSERHFSLENDQSAQTSAGLKGYLRVLKMENVFLPYVSAVHSRTERAAEGI